jgi:molybdopterin/thiamine biosynthesis adenylyltransferase
VTDRQERIPGYSQQSLAKACGVLIGCGGINSEVGDIVRKGIGSLILLDNDTVELSNLNRQRFYEEDLYKNKAIRLGSNLAKEGFCGTQIFSYGMSFEEAMEKLDLNCSFAVCGVDNNPTRVLASKFFGQKGIPLILIGVSPDAEHGYVFIQEKGNACFGCFLPSALSDTQRNPCTKAGAVKDILKALAGWALYGIDSLLMPRPRTWNLVEIHLAGKIQPFATLIPKREGCILCREIGG